MTDKPQTTKKKRQRITLKTALRIVYKETERRWEAADSEGDMCRCEHLNSFLEELTQEFGAL